MPLTDQQRRDFLEKIHGGGGIKTPANPSVDNQDLINRIKGSQPKPNLFDVLNERFEERGQKSMDSINAMAKGEQSTLETVGQFAGQGAGFLGDILFEGGKRALSKITPDVLEEPVVNAGKKMLSSKPVQSVLTGVSGAIDDFSKKHPRASRNIDAAINLSEILGLTSAAKKPATSALRQVSETTSDVLGGAKRAASKVDDVLPSSVTNMKKAAKSGSNFIADMFDGNKNLNLDQIAGRIAQGSKDDVPAFKRALTSISVDGIESFDDLSKSFDKKITSLSNDQSSLLGKTKKYTTEELTQSFKSEAGEVKANYVTKALEHLEELYTKTDDPKNLIRVREVRGKIDNEGLNLDEINKIAKEYGSKKSGFNLSGTPSTSVNKQGYENVRKGVKETIRGFMPSDKSKLIDEQISSLIKSKELTDKMVDSVNKLRQKTLDKTIAQQLGTKLGNLFNLLTLGSAKEFLFTIFGLRNQGFKTLNSIDLEKRLPKLLKEFDKLNKAKNLEETRNALLGIQTVVEESL
jgi:hypothetical protein